MLFLEMVNKFLYWSLDAIRNGKADCIPMIWDAAASVYHERKAELITQKWR